MCNAGRTQDLEKERETPRHPSHDTLPFLVCDPSVADHSPGGCFLGERDPSHLENNSIRFISRSVRENDAVSLARGWPQHDVPAIRRVRTGDNGVW